MAGHRLSGFFLERLRLGEIPPWERVSWLRLHRDPLLREEVRVRRAQLEAGDREFFASHDAEAAVESISMRAAQERTARSRESRDRRTRFWAMPLAAAAVLAVAWTASSFMPGRTGDAVRPKGVQAGLFCYRQGPDGVEALKPEDVVYSGDRIQLAYAAGAGRYGAILSLDGRGAVTLHFPADGAQSLRLASEGPVFLPYSFVLDDAPSFEEFRFFVSDAEFRLDEVYGFLEGKSDLPGGISMTRFVLKKGIRK